MNDFKLDSKYSGNWNRESLDGDQEDKKRVLLNSDNRLIYIYGDIDARNCADIAYEITSINIIDDDKESSSKNYTRKPIKIFFNSHGGSVYDMWLLVDTIMSSTTPVYTYCTGYAMSAAFIAFLAGDKRYMSPHATLMFHQISCWRYGKYQDIVDDREHMDEMNEQIEKFVSERTKIDEYFILESRKKKRDVYFSANEALDLSIIDEILNLKQPINKENTSKKNKKGEKKNDSNEREYGKG